MDKQVYILRVVFLLLLLVQLPVQAATRAGEVSYTRGVLTGQVDNESPRILGKGNQLHNGETLNTGSSGFAVIELEDGSRMTLRPNTSFKIENVDTRAGSENALMRLFRGGFRAITGLISKRKPGAFKVNTSVATIGIRGTEFDARLCEGAECDEENRATGQAPTRAGKVIGRVAVMNGRASAIDTNQQARALSTGAAIYEQDRLETGIKSFAVVAFNDNSRITMSPESVFQIEEHQYRPESAQDNNAFLRFVRGGLRLVTGLIGKFNQSSYRVATPTATIGIRGTGFDIACDGDCVDNTALFNPFRDTVLAQLMDYFVKPVVAASGSGMYTRVWDGVIELQFQGGKMPLQSGQVAFLKNAFSKPVIVPDFPVYLRAMGNAPRPDRISIPDDLLSAYDDQEIKPGLYVNVRDGEVDLAGADGRIVSLFRGQAGRVGLDGATLKLNFIPPFQKFDQIPNPSQLTPRMQRMIKMFGAEGSEKQEFECRLQ